MEEHSVKTPLGMECREGQPWRKSRRWRDTETEGRSSGGPWETLSHEDSEPEARKPV